MAIGHAGYFSPSTKKILYETRTPPSQKTYRVHMDIVVVICVVDGLEQSLHLPDSPPVHRHQEHYPRWRPFTEFVRDYLESLPRVALSRTGVPYRRVIQFPRLLQASHIVDELLADFGRGSVHC